MLAMNADTHDRLPTPTDLQGPLAKGSCKLVLGGHHPARWFERLQHTAEGPAIFDNQCLG